jgi:hypothetical protein
MWLRNGQKDTNANVDRDLGQKDAHLAIALLVALHAELDQDSWVPVVIGAGSDEVLEGRFGGIELLNKETHRTGLRGQDMRHRVDLGHDQTEGLLSNGVHLVLVMVLLANH